MRGVDGRSGELFSYVDLEKRVRSDQMTEVRGTGSAEPQDDGSIEIEFVYHLGDEAILKAVPMDSSTAC